MKKSKSILFMAVIFLGGCSMQPTIQKVSESKSGFAGAFYDGESYVASKDFPISEQYRIFEEAATGFVSIDAIKDDAEQRAKNFCSGNNKAMKTIKVQTSKPPHILGNFPRIEITFVCVDKPIVAAPATVEDILYIRLTNLKKLLDSGVITKEEFETQKARILKE